MRRVIIWWIIYLFLVLMFFFNLLSCSSLKSNFKRTQGKEQHYRPRYTHPIEKKPYDK